MKEAYKKILDEAFEKNVPNWQSLSPLDPLKVIADSVSLSLSEIENRQSRYIDAIMNTLPSLFSFYPKKAELPIGIFQLHANPKLRTAKVIPERTPLELELEDTQVTLAPVEDITLLPISDFQSKIERKSAQISLKQSGPCFEIALDYLPTAESKNNVTDYTITLLDSTGCALDTFSPVNCEIEDFTNNFSQYGKLIFRPKQGTYFSNSGSLLNLSLIFEKPFAGNFRVNTAPFEIYRSLSFQKLGYLAGEPWESFKLENDIIVPPSCLQLEYPDGKILSLHQLEHDILKLKETHPDRFTHSFFYDGVSHALIVPAGNRLTGEYNGGVSLTAPELVIAPPTDQIPRLAKAKLSNAYRHLVSIEQIAPFRPFIERENTEQYLDRFYSNLRFFNQSPQSIAILNSAELNAQILQLHDSIRWVESHIDDKRRKLEIYILTSHPQDITEPNIERAMHTKICEHLSKQIPLDYDLLVSPFFMSELEVPVIVQCQLSTARAGLLTEETLKERIKSAIEHVLTPHPFGDMNADAEYDREHLFSQVKRFLCHRRKDQTHLEKSEVLSVEGTFVRNEASRFEPYLTRRPGEMFRPLVDLKLSVKTASRTTDGEERNSLYA